MNLGIFKIKGAKYPSPNALNMKLLNTFGPAAITVQSLWGFLGITKLSNLYGIGKKISLYFFYFKLFLCPPDVKTLNFSRVLLS